MIKNLFKNYITNQKFNMTAIRKLKNSSSNKFKSSRIVGVID